MSKKSRVFAWDFAFIAGGVFFTQALAFGAGNPVGDFLSSRNVCVSTLLSLEDLIRLKKLVESDPALALMAKRLEGTLLEYAETGQLNRERMEGEVFLSLVEVRDRGLLPGVIAKAIEGARKHPAFPSELKVDEAVVVPMVSVILDAELHARGFFPGGVRKAAFTPWDELAKKQTAAVQASGKSPILRTQDFEQEFSQLTKTRFLPAGQMIFSAYAESALKETVSAIESAQQSIWMSTWAIYDDVIGSRIVDLLIEKKKKGIDVRVVVDRLTSLRPGYGKNVQRLEAEGVPTIRWVSEENPYFGQHGKELIIDARSDRSIVRHGGRNFGDVYYHTGGEGVARWDDVDLQVTGPATQDKATEFRRLWNVQVDRLKRDGAEKGLLPIGELGPRKEKNSLHGFSARVAFLEHLPNAAGEDPIYLGMLKAIESAQQTISIANAYFILTPALKDALIRARKRGVYVEVLTNSAESIDEKMITNPILKSLGELIPSGVEVYVKRGKDTLHAKYAVFDSMLTMVKSYNLHPRSLRYERETATVVLDSRFATEALNNFTRDTNKGRRVRSISELGMTKSKLGDYAEMYFFDQL
jgi:cardiolipin synthase